MAFAPQRRRQASGPRTERSAVEHADMVPLAQRGGGNNHSQKMRRSATGFRLGMAMQPPQPHQRVAPDSPLNNNRYATKASPSAAQQTPRAPQSGKENSSALSAQFKTVEPAGLALMGTRMHIGQEAVAGAAAKGTARRSADSRTALMSSRRSGRSQMQTHDDAVKSPKNAWLQESDDGGDSAATQTWELAKQKAAARHSDLLSVEDHDSVLVQSTSSMVPGVTAAALEEDVRNSRTRVEPQVTSSPQRRHSNASPNDTPSPPQRDSAERKPTIAEMVNRFRNSPATARSERKASPIGSAGSFWWQSGSPGSPGSPGSLSTRTADELSSNSAGSSPARDHSVGSSPAESSKNESPPQSLWAAMRSPGSVSSASSPGQDYIGVEECRTDSDDEEELDVLEMYRREQKRAQAAINRLSPLQVSDVESPPRSSSSRPLSSSVEALDAAAEHAVARAEMVLDDQAASETTYSASAEDDLLAQWRQQRDEVDALKAELFGTTDSDTGAAADSLESKGNENTGEIPQHLGKTEPGTEQQEASLPSPIDDTRVGRDNGSASEAEQTVSNGSAKALNEDPELEPDSTFGSKQPAPASAPLLEVCDTSREPGLSSDHDRASIVAREADSQHNHVDFIPTPSSKDGDANDGGKRTVDAQTQLQLQPQTVGDAAATSSCPSDRMHTAESSAVGVHTSSTTDIRVDGSPTKSSPPRSPHSGVARTIRIGSPTAGCAGPSSRSYLGKGHDGRIFDRLLEATVHRGLYGAFSAGWEAAVSEGIGVPDVRADKANGADISAADAAQLVDGNEIEANDVNRVESATNNDNVEPKPVPATETTTNNIVVKVEPEPEPEPNVVTELQPEPEPNVVTEPQPEPEIHPESEPEVVAEPQPEPEIHPESEPKVAPEPQPEPEAHREPEPEVEPEQHPMHEQPSTATSLESCERDSQPQSPEMKAAQSRLASIEARLADQQQRLKLFAVAASDTPPETQPKDDADADADAEARQELELETPPKDRADPVVSLPSSFAATHTLGTASSPAAASEEEDNGRANSAVTAAAAAAGVAVESGDIASAPAAASAAANPSVVGSSVLSPSAHSLQPSQNLATSVPTASSTIDWAKLAAPATGILAALSGPTATTATSSSSGGGGGGGRGGVGGGGAGGSTAELLGFEVADASDAGANVGQAPEAATSAVATRMNLADSVTADCAGDDKVFSSGVARMMVPTSPSYSGLDSPRGPSAEALAEVDDDHVVQLLRAQIKSYQEQLELLRR